jgi:hypothetical protein
MIIPPFLSWEGLVAAISRKSAVPSLHHSVDESEIVRRRDFTKEGL